MRTLAIDLGSKRVGLALSDEGGRFATPLDVLNVNSPDQALAPVLNVVKKEGVQRIVLGLPLNMDDTLGPAAKGVIAWSRQLADRAAGVPVVLVDERLSSFDAEQQLVERKRGGEHLTRKRKKEQLDALAAASFLQAFLDGRLPALSPDDFQG